MAKEELEDVRKRGHLFPPKTEAVVTSIKMGVASKCFTLEEIGSSDEELQDLLKKAGLA